MVEVKLQARILIYSETSEERETLDRLVNSDDFFLFKEAYDTFYVLSVSDLKRTLDELRRGE